MKIKLNSEFQRAELVVANDRLGGRHADIRATVAYIEDDVADDVLHELELSRATARANDHSELLAAFPEFRHPSSRGRCNAIGSLKRAIAKARK